MAFGSDTHRSAPRLDLPDSDSYAVDAAALLGASSGSQGCFPSSEGSAGSGSGCPGGPAVAAPGAVLGPENELLAAPVLFCLRAALGVCAGDPGYEVRAREVLCGGCGLHLGLSIVQLGRLHAGSTAGASGARFQRLAVGCCLWGRCCASLQATRPRACKAGLVQCLPPGCSCPRQAHISSSSASPRISASPLPLTPGPCSNWRELQLLGTCFLGKRYLRLRRPDGEEEHLGRPVPPASLAPYRCTAARSQLRHPGHCGALLFAALDVLSR